MVSQSSGADVVTRISTNEGWPGWNEILDVGWQNDLGS